MAKKSQPAANSRQDKIKAAQKASGSGVNKITIAGIVVILAIIAVVGGVIWNQISSEQAAGSGNTEPPAGATVEGGYRAFADVTPVDGAPTVDLYEDFQCPVCGTMEANLGETINELASAGEIILNYHVMNFLDAATGAEQSTPVANAAFCAADQGKWQEYHDAAFAGQITEGQSATIEDLTGFATTAGLSGTELETWTACAEAGKYDAYINDSNEQAGTDGVTGTPTMRINGEDFPTPHAATPEQLTAAVEAATE